MLQILVHRIQGRAPFWPGCSEEIKKRMKCTVVMMHLLPSLVNLSDFVLIQSSNVAMLSIKTRLSLLLYVTFIVLVFWLIIISFIILSH